MLNKDTKKSCEFFLDQSDEDVNEGEQDTEATKFVSGSSNEGGSDDEGNRRAPPEAFSSQQWPQSYKYNCVVHFFFLSLNSK